MLLPDSAVLNAAIEWLGHGLWDIAWWQVVLYTLVTTHITIAAVTIFLHRTQTHRAMDLGPIPSHFFRFWLWIGTGMVTKEWVAIHRKHHAKCETQDDPHSPQVKGIDEVLWRGAELYRAESKNKETMERYGHGTPDDWIERNLYSRYSWQGVGLMLILNLALFGTLGMAVWAVQMLWIPITAAGIINGIGHYWGYRNFEAPDASRNIMPWGLIIGGEELHNNHHTYPTSAKFSVKKYEFDIGWIYIQALQKLGWAKVKKAEDADGQYPARGQRKDARGGNRQSLRSHGRLCARNAPCHQPGTGNAEDQGRRSVGAQGRQALAAPRRRQSACIGPHARLAGSCRSPGAGQDGHDARRAAPALVEHLAVARAAGGRSGGLVPSGRGQRYRRPA
jgi:fatty-acid desaturase